MLQPSTNYARHRKTGGRAIQVVMHFLAVESGGWHGRAFRCRKLHSEAVPDLFWFAYGDRNVPSNGLQALFAAAQFADTALTNRQGACLCPHIITLILYVCARKSDL